MRKTVSLMIIFILISAVLLWVYTAGSAEAFEFLSVEIAGWGETAESEQGEAGYHGGADESDVAELSADRQGSEDMSGGRIGTAVFCMLVLVCAVAIPTIMLGVREIIGI